MSSSKSKSDPLSSAAASSTAFASRRARFFAARAWFGLYCPSLPYNTFCRVNDALVACFISACLSARAVRPASVGSRSARTAACVASSDTSSCAMSSAMSSSSSSLKSCASIKPPPNDCMGTKSPSSSFSGKPAMTAEASSANTLSASNSSLQFTTTSAEAYSLFFVRSGGAVKYGMRPLFQSVSTTRAACFMSGMPPFFNLPCMRAT
mmetsp:Transcript_217/g.554  ORF Transcript_217/g.554 Transcript_217/m.554 type:complete len:208 (+) Transcript_217:56-679(+)